MRRSSVLAVLAAAVVALASQVALAEGDATKGKKIFKKCMACHSLEVGKKKLGPSLAGLFGKTAGMTDGFKYSKAMKESGIVWDEATLDEFLTKTKAMVPRTRMTYPGLKKEQDRADVIAYLMEATESE